MIITIKVILQLTIFMFFSFVIKRKPIIISMYNINIFSTSITNDESVAKLLPSTLCWWHYLFLQKKGSRDIISETLIFTVLINSNFNYSIIVATLPDPTVLPPSLIANVRPCSIAIG